MHLIIEQVPVKALFEIPFDELAKLVTHEHQLFPRMAKHISVSYPEPGKFLPVITWHLADHRAFAVHHLIMGQHQDEIFVHCIHDGEGYQFMMVFPVDRVHAHIPEIVIHPAHVPLV